MVDRIVAGRGEQVGVGGPPKAPEDTLLFMERKCGCRRRFLSHLKCNCTETLDVA